MATKEEILSELIHSIGHKIKKRSSYQCDNELSDISFRDLELIEFIGTNKKTMSEIAEEINLTAGTVTTLVDKLIENKFLKRERDEEIDRRKVFISLDKKAKKVFMAHAKVKLEIANIMLENFKDKEKDKVIDIMSKINDNLSKKEK